MSNEEIMHEYQRVFNEGRARGQVEAKQEIDALRHALQDTMTWIDGWSPSFTEDPEWPEHEKWVKELLKG